MWPMEGVCLLYCFELLLSFEDSYCFRKNISIAEDTFEFKETFMYFLVFLIIQNFFLSLIQFILFTVQQRHWAYNSQFYLD